LPDVRAIRLRVADPDLERSRLTVAFRLLLAIPHFVWLVGWFYLAVLVTIANWIAALISGSPSPMLHRFLSAYVRYAAHVAAYVTLAANPFPGFSGRPGYPIDIEIDPPQRQNRWVTGFRLFLALPAILLADTLLGAGSSAAGGGYGSAGVAATVAFFAWFVCLFRGRMAQGFRDLLAYLIGYSAQVTGYLLLLTDRYPNSDPAVYEGANVFREDPIRVDVQDDLRRSRLTVFFRLLLAVPHFVWLTLWGIAVFFALIASWFATLFRGRTPAGLHRFISSYARYQVHVFAYIQLVGNPFPGFTGRPGSYPIDVEIAGPERQNRWVTGFRLILALPALMVSGALGTSAYVAAFLTWFFALARGRAPRGLRNLGAFELRYYAQLLGYLYLLTDSYPYSGPSAGWQLRLESQAATEG
jgi:cobalamin synthase